MNAVVDLRSDTVTRPSPGMRRAMLEAELGDDVFGDDPSVNRLQERAAEIFGFEAALLFPSGTQSNLAALISHCQRGDEVIIGAEQHSYRYEAGGLAVLGSINPRALPNRSDGTLDLAQVEAAINADDPHFARTRLLALENTIGGKPVPRSYLEPALALAKRRGLATHLDGARIFNAAVHFNTTVKELCAGFDSVSSCLSKGLGAPAGTVLLGSRELIARARRARKILGGAMRQAGVIAAAALVALEEMRERLVEDHRNAKRLAEGLAEIPGVRIDPRRVVTNIVSFEIDPAVMDAGSFQKACAEKGLRVSRYLGNSPRLRAVTHLDVKRDDIDAALDIARAVLVGTRAPVTAGR